LGLSWLWDESGFGCLRNSCFWSLGWFGNNCLFGRFCNCWFWNLYWLWRCNYLLWSRNNGWFWGFNRLGRFDFWSNNGRGFENLNWLLDGNRFWRLYYFRRFRHYWFFYWLWNFNNSRFRCFNRFFLLNNRCGRLDNDFFFNSLNRGLNWGNNFLFNSRLNGCGDCLFFCRNLGFRLFLRSDCLGDSLHEARYFLLE